MMFNFHQFVRTATTGAEVIDATSRLMLLHDILTAISNADDRSSPLWPLAETAAASFADGELLMLLPEWAMCACFCRPPHTDLPSYGQLKELLDRAMPVYDLSVRCDFDDQAIRSDGNTVIISGYAFTVSIP